MRKKKGKMYNTKLEKPKNVPQRDLQTKTSRKKSSSVERIWIRLPKKKIYKIKRKKERKKKPNKTKAQTLTKMKNLQMLIFFPRWECIS